ncbi:TlpA family protein disulfide reductase [Undibacterium sp. Rencai35W]|uniref:TlpA family protein disulfide reductase n=1 Tax=unclassified Undibacterium TaxID=2630295 RepID=UPI003BF08D35
MLAPSSPRKFKIFSVFAAVALVTLAVLFYQSLSNKAPVPDVTFVNLKGEKISTQSLRGKVVMVNFWATSCTTCVAEMPRMIETYNKYHQQGLEYVAVAMSYDPPNYVLNYTETRQLPFQVALDVEGKLAKAFGDVKLTPTTYVIDKQGNILKRYVGEPSFAELHALLEKALAT